MPELQLFSSHDLSLWEVKQARQNASGQGKSVYLDRPDGDFITEEVNVAWPIRPSMVPPEGSQVKETERLNLEISIPKDLLAFSQKAMQLDEMLKLKLYEDKVACFGPTKAKALTSAQNLSVLYKPMLKEGGMNKDGTQQYPDTVRGKVDGWSSCIQKLNFVEKDIGGQKTKMVEDCEWSPRLVSQGLKSGDTKFFMYLGKNAETGKERYTDRLPFVDESGEKRLRFVGPQDCKRGSKVCVVFRISKVYITETAGPTLSIKEVYIKSLPNKADVKVMDGAELVDEDELLSLLDSSGGILTTTSSSLDSSSGVTPQPSSVTSTSSTTQNNDAASSTPLVSCPESSSGKHQRNEVELEFQELTHQEVYTSLEGTSSKPSKKKKESSS